MTVIDPQTKHRAAEIVGLGLTQAEAARACEISLSSLERILSKPEYRKVVDDTRRKRTSLAAEVGHVVRDLIEATDTRGNPDMHLRQKGVELYARNPDLLDIIEQVDENDHMLPGVVLCFPYRPPQPAEAEPVE